MGQNCCGRPITDNEIEGCKNFQDLISVMESRQNLYKKEKEELETYEKDQTIIIKNVTIYTTPDDIEDMKNSIDKIYNEFNRGIQILLNYEKNLEFSKAKEIMKKLSLYANEKDYNSMEDLMNELLNYCQSHF